jgi:hypothetical protein
MTTKELLIQEIETLPPELLKEALILFEKSKPVIQKNSQIQITYAVLRLKIY